MTKYRVRVEGWDTDTRKRGMRTLADPFEDEGHVQRRSLLDTQAEAAALVAELTLKNNRTYDYTEVEDTDGNPTPGDEPGADEVGQGTAQERAAPQPTNLAPAGKSSKPDGAGS